MLVFLFIIGLIELADCGHDCQYLNIGGFNEHVYQRYDQHCAKLVCKDDKVQLLRQRECQCNLKLAISNQRDNEQNTFSIDVNNSKEIIFDEDTPVEDNPINPVVLMDSVNINVTENVEPRNDETIQINDNSVKYNSTAMKDETYLFESGNTSVEFGQNLQRGVKTCKVNDKHFAVGEVVFSMEGKCLEIICTQWMNKDPHLDDGTIPDCECKKDEDLEYANYWTYFGRNGQGNWHKDYPSCRGNRQSPINLNTLNTTGVLSNVTSAATAGGCLMFQNYGVVPKNIKLINNGNFLTMKFRFGQLSPVVRNSFLSGEEYVFKEIELRVGEHVNSEDRTFVLSSSFADFEVHLMHHKRIYKSLNEAKKAVDDESAVLDLSVFVDNNNPFDDICVEEKKVDVKNSFGFMFEKLINPLGRVRKPYRETLIKPKNFILSNLIQNIETDCTLDYFTYFGSSSYPPCTQNHLKIIYNEKQKLCITKQRTLFQTLELLEFLGRGNKKIYGFQYRDTVPDNGRPVFLVQSGPAANSTNATVTTTTTTTTTTTVTP